MIQNEMKCEPKKTAKERHRLIFYVRIVLNKQFKSVRTQCAHVPSIHSFIVNANAEIIYLSLKTNPPTDFLVFFL